MLPEKLEQALVESLTRQAQEGPIGNRARGKRIGLGARFKKDLESVLDAEMLENGGSDYLADNANNVAAELERVGLLKPVNLGFGIRQNGRRFLAIESARPVQIGIEVGNFTIPRIGPMLGTLLGLATSGLGKALLMPVNAAKSLGKIEADDILPTTAMGDRNGNINKLMSQIRLLVKEEEKLGLPEEKCFVKNHALSFLSQDFYANELTGEKYEMNRDKASRLLKFLENTEPSESKSVSDAHSVMKRIVYSNDPREIFSSGILAGAYIKTLHAYNTKDATISSSQENQDEGKASETRSAKTAEKPKQNNELPSKNSVAEASASKISIQSQDITRV